MMTAQSGSQLPPKETVLRGGFELSVLREKYGLTDDRYALLLYNVYQAVAGGGSLAPAYAAAPEPDPGYGAGRWLLRGHGHASRSALETDVQQRRGYPGGHLCFQQGRRRRHGDPAVYL